MDVNWVAFLGVVLVAYVVPGPDFAVILRCATRGWRSGGAAALGAQTGLCVHMLLAVVGLSVVLSRHPEALTAVRIAGGLYLLWLGGRLVLPTVRRPASARPEEVPDSPPDAPSTRSAFGQAMFTNLLNPKAILFFASVLPQFLVSGSTPMWLQVGVLGVIDILLGFVVWAGVIALGVRAASLLSTSRVRAWWDRVTGMVFCSLGGGLLATRD